ncbi:MAG: amino acid adenylation domain-containing protein, partial [Lysobacter sp.]|nr:amino acid adenylation domain-containing protein [Lysobacter sp.]
ADLAEGYANQEAPFEWVVREAHPHREFARNPLFQTAVSTHNSPGPRLEWPEFSLKIHEVYGNRTSKFDVDAVMIPRATDDPDGITLFWEYCVALYRRETIVRLNEAYLRVLAQCVARPTLRVSEAEFLAPEERTRLLEGGFRVEEIEQSDMAASGAVPATIPAAFLHAGFEAHAAHAPDASAVEDGDRIATYGESNARANRLARHLRALGVGPDRPVALCMARSIAAVEAVLAVVKAGGAYLPLDPMLPEDRLAFVLADACPPIVLTDRAHRDAVERIVAAQASHSATPARIVDLDADAAAWASLSASNLDPAEIGLTQSHLAYVIYTSGSTGTPKGVLVEHRQIMAIAAGWRRQYDLAPGVRHLQMANLAFDVFTADLLRALGHGGTLVLCPQETLADPAALEARLREARIEIADFVPVVLDALVAHLDTHGRDLGFMRTIVCGSDRWSVEAADRARRVVGDGVRLLHAYGLTETSVDSTCFEIAPLPIDAPPLAVLPIGDAVANARALVLDRRGRPAPIGVVGELCIGGAGVARGYLARPELQAERFLDSPFHPGERLYRTGDLGRRLAEGGIEFLGRNDAQVKIRGHRVELGEIEARLRSMPEIEDAAVVLRSDSTASDDGASDAVLVAYVLPSDRDASPNFDAVHRALQTKLPAHMLPAAYVAMRAWPKTANGKLDRAALPSPPPAAFVATGAFVAPSTPIEEAIAEIWGDVLGRDTIGVRDDFFRLGGNSLSAMRVLVALRDMFGVGLSLRRLFEAPTIEGLVEAMLDESMQHEVMQHEVMQHEAMQHEAMQHAAMQDKSMQTEPAPGISAEDTEAIV